MKEICLRMEYFKRINQITDQKKKTNKVTVLIKREKKELR